MTAQPDTTPIRLTSLSHGAGCACKLPLSALGELMLSLGPGVLGGAAGDLLVVGQVVRGDPGHLEVRP